jgi:hypothetical protein
MDFRAHSAAPRVTAEERRYIARFLGALTVARPIAVVGALHRRDGLHDHARREDAADDDAPPGHVRLALRDRLRGDAERGEALGGEQLVGAQIGVRLGDPMRGLHEILSGSPLCVD